MKTRDVNDAAMVSFKSRPIYVLKNSFLYPWERNSLSVRIRLDVVVWRKTPALTGN
jgi:hypothetical protein